MREKLSQRVVGDIVTGFLPGSEFLEDRPELFRFLRLSAAMLSPDGSVQIIHLELLDPLIQQFLVHCTLSISASDAIVPSVVVCFHP
jgi:hypothetical protein